MKQILAKIINLFSRGRIISKDKSNNLGAIPNEKDDRDYIIKVGDSVAKELPKTVSLKPWIKEIKNQSAGNACVLFSLCSCYEIMAAYAEHPHQNLPLSEMFGWYEARKMRGWHKKNSGTYPRDVCKVFREGFTLEQLFRYNWSKWHVVPGLAAYWMRSLFKIKSYYKVYDMDSLKTTLASGIPVSITMPVSEIAGTQQTNGYHQVTIIGYNETTKKVTILNSWGKAWGKGGYFELSYARIINYLNYTTVVIPWFW